MPERKYLPTFAELLDRASIVLLKSIFLSENKEAYQKELSEISHDLDLIVKENQIVFNSDTIKTAMLLALSNREIWLNESRARLGGAEQDKLLKFTHSLNGQRSRLKNAISEYVGERTDKKVDCLAAEFQTKEFIEKHGDWSLFE